MLLQYVLAAFLLAQGCLAIRGRVVDGEESPPHQFPYLASIVWGHPPLLRYRHVCGGTILRENWVLTAGHCITSLPAIGKLGVMAGKHILNQQEDTQQFSDVSLRIVHWKYAGKYGENDIALLKLVSPLRLREEVQSIDLPRDSSLYSGSSVFAGWGSISQEHFPIYPEVLQVATVPIITNLDCWDEYHKYPGDVEIYETQICTKSINVKTTACVGDDGGPLIMYVGRIPHLIGVIAKQKFPCSSELPTVYTRVSAYTEWIEHKMNN